MIFAHFLLPETFEVNAFIAACPDTREACLIDAGACDPRFAPFLRAHNLRLTKVFITHTHWDHVDGLPEIVAHFNPEVYSYAAEVKGIPARPLRHGDPFSIGNCTGRVVHTPGHTPDGISLIIGGMAFTGDALFSGSVGGTANDADRQQQLDAIREHLFVLPGDTEVHCGHGPSSTIAVERQYNPFFV